jgi:hypothetical protein
MSFQLASDLKTRQTVWIRDGKTYDPIKVCAHYRETYASDVKQVTV